MPNSSSDRFSMSDRYTVTNEKFAASERFGASEKFSVIERVNSTGERLAAMAFPVIGVGMGGGAGALQEGGDAANLAGNQEKEDLALEQQTHDANCK